MMIVAQRFLRTTLN